MLKEMRTVDTKLMRLERGTKTLLGVGVGHAHSGYDHSLGQDPRLYTKEKELNSSIHQIDNLIIMIQSCQLHSSYSCPPLLGSPRMTSSHSPKPHVWAPCFCHRGLNGCGMLLWCLSTCLGTLFASTDVFGVHYSTTHYSNSFQLLRQPSILSAELKNIIMENKRHFQFLN